MIIMNVLYIVIFLSQLKNIKAYIYYIIVIIIKKNTEVSQFSLICYLSYFIIIIFYEYQIILRVHIQVSQLKKKQ